MKTSTLQLPEELILEILLRLPVRSVLRFRCVCKTCLSLISDSRFAKRHFDLAAAPTHRIILKKILKGTEIIESLDLDSESLHGESAVVRLHVPPHHHHYRIWNCFNGLEISGSCRGFVLLTESESVMIVWNPSTGTCRRIKISTNFDTSIGKGIGYDESTDDYLIVLIGLNRLNVFSIKTNSSYSIRDATEVGYDELAYVNTIGLFLNHSLHWLVELKAKKIKLVLVFNLLDRSFSEIELPVPYEVGRGDYFLTIMGGSLGLCLETGSKWRAQVQMVEIWVMKEYKVHSSWIQSLSLPLDDDAAYAYDCFAPTWFTKGGGILGSSRCGRLISLNHKGEILKDRECRPHDRRIKHYDIYRESLLSLPGDFAEEEETTYYEEEDEDEEPL